MNELIDGLIGWLFHLLKRVKPTAIIQITGTQPLIML